MSRFLNRLMLGISLVSASTVASNGQVLDLTNPQTVLPGKGTQVVLSNRDVNRIVCLPGKIDGYKYSAEKGGTVDDFGSEAFIKFTIEQIGDELNYVERRNEFFFICDGVTYTLLSRPSDVPAQTIFLAGGRAGAAETNKMKFKPLSEEERAVSITVSMLKDDIPPSYRVEPSEQKYNRTVLQKADVRLRRELSIEGTDYSAKEFLVRARASINLDERAFLDGFFGNSIYAVTLEKMALDGGEVGRVVIVYRGAIQ